MARRAVLTVGTLITLTRGAAASREGELDWFLQAAAAPVNADAGRAGYVVLLDEMDARWAKNGHVATRRRRAIRIVTREGREAAHGMVFYDSGSDQVRSLRAWVLKKDGRVVEYDESRAFDVAIVNGNVYDESRCKTISASASVDAGDAFAFESEEETAPPFTQMEWAFGDEAPVQVSRFRVTLPSGWTLRDTVSDGAPPAATGGGDTFQWERRDLPGVADEPEGPPRESCAPRLQVTCRPPAGARIDAQVFSSWKDVSRWLFEISEGTGEQTPELQAQTRALVAPARTERDSAAAVARFVQSIRYAAIELGIGRGGGYRPHRAADVLLHSYGDCKDKANLMRAMLGAIGVPAHLTVVYSGDPEYVRDSWPSPQQFNHCILAIDLRRPGGGVERMFFDPTDPSTPLGELPVSERGSLALVIEPRTDGLTRLPEPPPEADLQDRWTEITLQADGAVSGRMQDRMQGAPAAQQRRLARNPLEYRRRLDLWTATDGPIQLVRLSCSGDTLRQDFVRTMEFSGPAYAQLLQGRLMIFRPLVVDRSNVPTLAEERRALPIVLPSTAMRESVTVHLPPGFVADEVPQPVRLDTAFGRYRAVYQMQGEDLTFVRSLTVPRARLAPERLPEVRDFFQSILAAQQAPVILARR